jgi:hypothetical protein
VKKRKCLAFYLPAGSANNSSPKSLQPEPRKAVPGGGLLVPISAVWRRRLPAAVAAVGSPCRCMATRTVPSPKERSDGNQNPGLIRTATRGLDRMMGLDITVAAAVPVVPA